MACLLEKSEKRISKELAPSFLADLAALPVVLEQFPAETVFDRIQQLSREHELTAYDAAYLDLSLNSGLPLATLDEHLIRACTKAQAKLVQG
jgi:predicted nucleic acid-binding protein